MTGAPIFTLERPTIERQIAALIADHPDLGPYGYWSPLCPGWRTSRDQFHLERESASVQPFHVDGFRWAQQFLLLSCRRLASGRSKNRINSYSLKHTAEEAFGRQVYVGNGICIFAALSLGLRVERDRNGPNAQVAVRVLWEGAR